MSGKEVCLGVLSGRVAHSCWFAIFFVMFDGRMVHVGEYICSYECVEWNRMLNGTILGMWSGTCVGVLNNSMM